MVPSGLRDYLASSPEFRVEETEEVFTCFWSQGQFVRGPAGSGVCSAVPGLIFAGTSEVLCRPEVEEEPTRKTLTSEARELGFGV